MIKVVWFTIEIYVCISILAIKATLLENTKNSDYFLTHPRRNTASFTFNSIIHIGQHPAIQHKKKCTKVKYREMSQDLRFKSNVVHLLTLRLRRLIWVVWSLGQYQHSYITKTSLLMLQFRIKQGMASVRTSFLSGAFSLKCYCKTQA